MNGKRAASSTTPIPIIVCKLVVPPCHWRSGFTFGHRIQKKASFSRGLAIVVNVVTEAQGIRAEDL